MLILCILGKITHSIITLDAYWHVQMLGCSVCTRSKLAHQWGHLVDDWLLFKDEEGSMCHYQWTCVESLVWFFHDQWLEPCLALVPGLLLPINRKKKKIICGLFSCWIFFCYWQKKERKEEKKKKSTLAPGLVGRCENIGLWVTNTKGYDHVSLLFPCFLP